MTKLAMIQTISAIGGIHEVTGNRLVVESSGIPTGVDLAYDDEKEVVFVHTAKKPGRVFVVPLDNIAYLDILTPASFPAKVSPAPALPEAPPAPAVDDVKRFGKVNGEIVELKPGQVPDAEPKAAPAGDPSDDAAPPRPKVDGLALIAEAVAEGEE